MSQGLVDRNGRRYFSDSLTEEVGELVEPLVERRMKSSNMSREQAERETNIAIVDETEEGSFFIALLKAITNKVLPAIQQVAKGVTAVTDVVSKAIPFVKKALEAHSKKGSECSVM